jgi:hypothetical protein
MFIKQLEQLEGEVQVVLDNRVAKASRKAPPAASLTQDAATQQEEEGKSEEWCRSGSSREIDTTLRMELKELFGNATIKKSHDQIKAYFDGDESKTVIGYSTFLAFMKGERKIPMKPKDRKVFSEYIAKQNHGADEENN